MKLVKLRFLPVFALTICLLGHTVSASLHVNNTEQDENSLLNEEDGTIRPQKQKSFFARNKKEIFIAAAVLVTGIGLTAAGTYAWKNRPTFSTLEEVENATNQMFTNDEHLNLLPITNLVNKQLKANLQSSHVTSLKNELLQKPQLSEAAKEAVEKLNLTLLHLIDTCMSKVFKPTSSPFVTSYTEELKTNPHLQKLRQGLEKALSHDHNVTKEEIRELGTLAIMVLQTHCKNNKDTIALKMTKESDDSRQIKEKELSIKFLDDFSAQKAVDWINVLEKSVAVIENHKQHRKQLEENIKANVLKEETGNAHHGEKATEAEIREKVKKELDESFKKLNAQHEEYLNESRTLLEQLIKEELTKKITASKTNRLPDGITEAEAMIALNQDITSQVKAGRVPTMFAGLVKKIPLLSEIFPELRTNTIPPLFVPFVNLIWKTFLLNQGNDTLGDSSAPLKMNKVIEGFYEYLHEIESTFNPLEMLAGMLGIEYTNPPTTIPAKQIEEMIKGIIKSHLTEVAETAWRQH